ncbi:MAG TPA: NTP transferase domain-containing protein [Allosphingosinicella sp.]|uniref:NTP transferase domain-containing protein n=1 Tax=Allosphingosinicella sp. TaxID=2823234 RepID=UPI002F276DDD
MPADAGRPFTAIILAAQRNGKLDPLAAEAGVTHKCLVTIVDRPLIEWVIEALTPVPGLQRIRICIEPEAIAAVRAVRGASGELGIPVDFVASAPTITDSAYASAQGVDPPMILTTGDNVNLTPAAVERMLGAVADGADVAVAMASRPAVLAAHPEGQRRFYEFSDEAYSNCNLYAIGSHAGLKMAETFREGGQFAKNRARLVSAFGWFNILLFRFKLLSLAGAMKRLSARFGLRIAAVVLEDGGHAVDVDNRRTYIIADIILRERLARNGSLGH